ncbi:MoaD/ThiS family protein [Quadrisphaera sp. KR29]|uniref:MoaD/ThiS family protein n=1 Tax=Quadrisphaera sp. KR29 TaxID=3461391 RepID=UPI00404514FB
MQVRYFAGAAAAAGTDEEPVELPDGATAEQLVGALAQRHPRLGAVLEVATLLVEEVAVRDRTTVLPAPVGGPLQVDVLPPFAGG